MSNLDRLAASTQYMSDDFAVTINYLHKCQLQYDFIYSRHGSINAVCWRPGISNDPGLI